MEKQIFIKPAKGRLVINPITNEAILDEGEFVELNNHILRCLENGDCIEAEEPTTPETKSK